jgi:hypothetical protein
MSLLRQNNLVKATILCPMRPSDRGEIAFARPRLGDASRSVSTFKGIRCSLSAPPLFPSVLAVVDYKITLANDVMSDRFEGVSSQVTLAREYCADWQEGDCRLLKERCLLKAGKACEFFERTVLSMRKRNWRIGLPKLRERRSRRGQVNISECTAPHVRDRSSSRGSGGWARSTPGVINRRLEKTYGLSPSKLAVMLAAQNWQCAICARSFRTMSKRERHIDHDHRTGRGCYVGGSAIFSWGMPGMTWRS